MFFEAITSTFPYWRSETEGFLGLAPYTINDQFPPNTKEYNFMYQMKEIGAIEEMIFAFDFQRPGGNSSCL